MGALMVLAGIGGLVTRAGAPSEDAPDSASEPQVSELPTSESPASSPTQEDPPSAEEIVRAFVRDLSTAIKGGDDPRFLFESLHPAVIDLYGAPACRRSMRDFGDPTFRMTVRTVSALKPWDWAVDNRSIPIDDVYTVAVTRVSNGERSNVPIHLGAVEGGVGWFTDCGDPLS